MTTRRTFLGTTATALIAAPAIARADTLKWRMVTSWPKRLPGPGMSAERIATRIKTMSNGRIDIAVHAAGEIVPAFGVLDAVGNGVADSATPPRATGRARCRLRTSSPLCRSA